MYLFSYRSLLDISFGYLVLADLFYIIAQILTLIRLSCTANIRYISICTVQSRGGNWYISRMMA